MRRRMPGGAIGRVVSAIAIIASLGLMSAHAAAQEELPASSDYVGVSCSYDAGMDVSWCSFTPSSPVDALTVPLAVFCAPVADLGDGGWDDAGVSGGGSLSLALAGVVNSGGSASYTVMSAGGPVEVPGDGLVCTSSTDSEQTVEEETPPTNAEAPPATNITDERAQEPPVEPPADDSGDVSAQEEADQPVEPEAPVLVTITVRVFNCDTDPEGGDPAASPDCAPAGNVSVSASADGTALGTTVTDGSGQAFFDAPDGSELEIAEDTSTIPSGYQPLGSGVAFATAAAGGGVTIVNLVEPIVGRLQIVSGTCPTSGDSYTDFRVIEPREVQAAAETACAIAPGTVFTLQGDSLGGGMQVATGDDGAWRGYLPEGTYTVVDESGASVDVRVLVDEISVVVAVNYVSNPLGVLNLSRQVCTDADDSGVDMAFGFDEPVLGDQCELVDGQMTVEAVAEVSVSDVTTVTLGADGVEEIEVPPGSYLVTDVTSGDSVAVEVPRSSRVYVVALERIEATGGSGDGGGNAGGGDDGGQPGGGDNAGGDDGGDDHGGDGTGGNTGGEDTGTDDGGGDAVSGVDDGQTDGDAVTGGGETAYGVTTLPSTGTGGQDGQPLLPLGLLLAGAGLAGAWALRRRAAA